MINFSLSPSSINLYNDSQIQFYYQYITKEKPDTKTIQIYGKSGRVVHKVLENYAIDKTINYETQFGEMWAKENLHIDVGFNGDVLDKLLYLDSVWRGVQLMKTKHNVIKPEESIEFPLTKNKQMLIRIKGVVDCICRDKKGVYIVDWKTASTVDSIKKIKIQGLHYCLMYYLKYKIIPHKVVFEYIKINKIKEFSFTKEDLRKHMLYVKQLAKDIFAKGNIIDNYEVGNINSPFNGHKKKCLDLVSGKYSRTVKRAIEDLADYFEKEDQRRVDLMPIQHIHHFNREQFLKGCGVK